MEPRRAREQPDLAFFPLGDLDQKLAFPTLDSFEEHAVGTQEQPLDHRTLPQPPQHGDIRDGHDPDSIQTRNSAARMEQRLGQHAVVREDEKAFRIEVQPPHRLEPVRLIADEIEDGGVPSLTPAAHQCSRGLVIGEVSKDFAPGEGDAVEGDAIALGIDFGAHTLRRRAVDPNAPFADPAIRFAPR